MTTNKSIPIRAIAETIALLVLFVVVQVLCYFGMNALFAPSFGNLMAWATVATACVMIGFLAWLAVCRQNIAVYFGNHQLGKWQDWAIGFGLLFVFWLASEVAGRVFGKTPMDFMDELLATGNFIFLVFAVVIVAPIYEEVLFRGAIFGRIYHSATKYRFWWASVVSAIAFAVVHGQYDWFGLLLIFVLAFVLAWARAKTGGLFLPMALHIVNNGVAMVVYLLEKS